MDNADSTCTDIDMMRVRTLFASPAHVAASGFMRREVSARMQERLDLLKLAPQAVLDAGCGMGEDLNALRQRYPQAKMIGADISTTMLAVARERSISSSPLLRRWVNRWRGADAAPRLLREDFAATSLSNGSVDLLWSNLALHWHASPQKVFAEWQRVLRVDGALMFSCFGPDTFKEVRQAFATVDDCPHALMFTDMHDLGDMLVAAGFPAPVMDMDTITVTYESPQDLIADVRAFGGNPLAQRRRGLLSRRQGARAMQMLEAQRKSDGKITLTFEIVYGHAFKDAPTKTTQGETVVRFMPRA